MALSPYEYSYKPEERLTAKQLADNFSDRLPVLVAVSTGFYGNRELNTFSTGQILRLHELRHQERALVHDDKKRTLSVPLDFSNLFTIKNHPDPLILRQALEKHQPPVEVKFADPHVHFDPPCTMTSLKVIRVYKEPYFIANTVSNGVLLEEVIPIPLYLKQVTFSPVVGVSWQSLSGKELMDKLLHPSSLDCIDFTKDHCDNEMILLSNKSVKAKDDIHKHIDVNVYISVESSRVSRQQRPMTQLSSSEAEQLHTTTTTPTSSQPHRLGTSTTTTSNDESKLPPSSASSSSLKRQGDKRKTTALTSHNEDRPLPPLPPPQQQRKFSAPGLFHSHWASLPHLTPKSSEKAARDMTPPPPPPSASTYPSSAYGRRPSLPELPPYTAPSRDRVRKLSVDSRPSTLNLFGGNPLLPPPPLPEKKGGGRSAVVKFALFDGCQDSPSTPDKERRGDWSNNTTPDNDDTPPPLPQKKRSGNSLASLSVLSGSCGASPDSPVQESSADSKSKPLKALRDYETPPPVPEKKSGRNSKPSTPDASDGPPTVPPQVPEKKSGKNSEPSTPDASDGPPTVPPQVPEKKSGKNSEPSTPDASDGPPTVPPQVPEKKLRKNSTTCAEPDSPDGHPPSEPVSHQPQDHSPSTPTSSNPCNCPTSEDQPCVCPSPLQQSEKLKGDESVPSSVTSDKNENSESDSDSDSDPYEYPRLSKPSDPDESPYDYARSSTESHAARLDSSSSCSRSSSLVYKTHEPHSVSNTHKTPSSPDSQSHGNPARTTKVLSQGESPELNTTTEKDTKTQAEAGTPVKPSGVVPDNPKLSKTDGDDSDDSDVYVDMNVVEEELNRSHDGGRMVKSMGKGVLLKNSSMNYVPQRRGSLPDSRAGLTSELKESWRERTMSLDTCGKRPPRKQSALAKGSENDSQGIPPPCKFPPRPPPKPGRSPLQKGGSPSLPSRGSNEDTPTGESRAESEAPVEATKADSSPQALESSPDALGTDRELAEHSYVNQREMAVVEPMSHKNIASNDSDDAQGATAKSTTLKSAEAFNAVASNAATFNTEAAINTEANNAETFNTQVCNSEVSTAAEPSSKTPTSPLGHPPLLKGSSDKLQESQPQQEQLQALEAMSMADVQSLLSRLHMKRYLDKFEELQVDGLLLSKLDDEALKEDFHMTRTDMIKLRAFITDGHLPS